MTIVGWLAVLLAALPAVLCLVNRWALARRLASVSADPAPPHVSILIPARDEAANIGPALDAARASQGVRLEILVMDDGSTDATAAIVRDHAGRDPRVRLLQAPPLPDGWGGKAHVCQRLSEQAQGDFLLFVDADVRLAPDAALVLADHARRHRMGLVSAVPRQRMATLGELLTVPMINLLIHGYLPVPMMRRQPTDPSLAAACGQLLLFERSAYQQAGGHAAVRWSRHDGLQLARHLRRRGIPTDLIDGARLATCRMYDGLRSAWEGFVKNAREGMATPAALPVWTFLLLGGHVLPWLLLVLALLGWGSPVPALLALLLSLGMRLAVTLLAREPLASVPLHPLTVLVALAIQWDALIRGGTGRQVGWKGRSYPSGAAP
ncbi:glycosyltransferase [Geminicoccus harenae]|uniref:glycosyltransferase n=1 Tax=Geminicoccus harenae TaxID=2498453 RepID=UPI001C96FAB3|nr:glycosyltransferase family 2 protein [Geminicoccus harenae]